MLNLIPSAQEAARQYPFKPEPSTLHTPDKGLDISFPGEAKDASDARTEVIQNVIQLGTELQYLLEPKTVQLNSPHHIPSPELQTFLKQRARLLCITQDRLVVPVSLRAVEEQQMVVDLDRVHSRALRHRQSESVTVLFLGAQNRNYLIHAEIAEISATEIQLAYQDPRADRRFVGGLDNPVIISDLRPKKFLELVVGTVEPVRETTRLLAQNQCEHTITRLEDILRQKHPPHFFHTDEYINKGVAIQSQVHDLSAGGVHLIIKGSGKYEFHENRIHHLTMELGTTETRAGDAGHSVILQVLTLCRGGQYRTPHTHLHCRFLCPLPTSLVESYCTSPLPAS